MFLPALSLIFFSFLINYVHHMFIESTFWIQSIALGVVYTYLLLLSFLAVIMPFLEFVSETNTKLEQKGSTLQRYIFPYWPSYFRVWISVLFEWENKITLINRLSFCRRLIFSALTAPIWKFCWILDEYLYPNYRQTTITKPAFILTQPRSGSTLLHRTLANHEEFFAVKHIEWRYPFIFMQKIFNSKIGNYFLRPLLLKSNYWPNTKAGKIAQQMHPNDMSDYEEDGIFFEECCFYHPFITLRFPFLSLFSYTFDFKQLPCEIQQRMMVFHQRTLQKVAFLRLSERPFTVDPPVLRYLSKECFFFDKTVHLERLYPDASYLSIVRDPFSSLQSLANLIQMSICSKTGIMFADHKNDQQPNQNYQVGDNSNYIQSIDDTTSTAADIQPTTTTTTTTTTSEQQLAIELYKQDPVLLFLNNQMSTFNSQIKFFQNLPKKSKSLVDYDIYVKDMKKSAELIIDQIGAEQRDSFSNYLSELESRQSSHSKGGYAGHDSIPINFQKNDPIFHNFVQFKNQTRCEHQSQL